MAKFIALVLLVVATASVSAKEALKVVPNKEVCMVNNTFFGTPQIPVEHKGKTYYGCCENCKKTLAEDETARVGTDALTNQPVDKATAVIAMRPDKSVLYFANKDNFKKFLEKK